MVATARTAELGPVENHPLRIVVLVFGDGPAAVFFAEHLQLDPAGDGVGELHAGLLERAGGDDVELDHGRVRLGRGIDVDWWILVMRHSVEVVVGQLGFGFLSSARGAE